MALIGKIRQNMWFVFALLGVALVAFMMMDSSPGGGGGAAGATAIDVNGKKIDINRLQQIESIESNATGMTGNSLRKRVFDDFITRSIVESEGEAMGLSVSEDELGELLYGSRLSPIVQQMPMFVDPRTRTINSQTLQDVKSGYEDKSLNPGFTALWDEKIEQVKAAEIQNDIATLVSKAIYTPTWMANELSKTNSIVADLDYVKIPFSAIQDADVKVTDADYTAYMSNNKAQFNNKEEGRVVEYVVFDVTPTTSDSIAIRQNLLGKIDDFKNPPSGDSLFALTNGGNYINFYFPKEDLPEPFQAAIDDIEIGDVYGPIINERFFSAVKLIDKKVVADSVELSHIFRRTTADDPIGIATAVDYIDSLKNLIETNQASYDSLAIKFSQDPTSAVKGGDLGYVPQGQFFPAINDVAFFSGQIGKLYTVKSQNGVHLIKVTDRVFTTQDPKYKVAFINNGIEPSEETIVNVTNQASEFISDNRNIEAFRSSLAKYPNASIKTSAILKKGDYSFEQFQFADDSRDIVLWAFNEETEVGDVSPDIYAFRDKQFNYESSLVIPALQAKTPKGMAKLGDVKNSIADQVKEFAKGRMVADMVKGKSMDDAAAMAGATRGTVAGARTGSAFVGEIGYEPKVAAAILSTNQGQTTQPIIGTAGVYILNLTSKSAPNTGNAAFAKQSENVKARQNVNFNLFDAMKSDAEVKDKRMDFGM